MKYDSVIQAEFIDRPNRFIAHVIVGGKIETVHVKNTGRCRELLLPHAEVYLAESGNPSRKTRYDLIAVRKANGLLINIDSQAPNRVMYEWLLAQKYCRIIPEYSYGTSRIDFYLEQEAERYLLEVKGCTLEKEGIGYFPDAPTERGVKHLRELTHAVEDGFHSMLAFVIQMDGIKEVRPNLETHPEFGMALEEAEQSGVEILFMTCHVESDELTIIGSCRRDNNV